MKNLVIPFIFIFFITSCRNAPKTIVSSTYIDSLVTNYSPSQTMQTADSNLVFWQRRMQKETENFVNGPEYAATLSSNFHLYGNINDLLSADSLMLRSNEANQEKEPGIFRNLASFAMLQHQFQKADSFLQKAKNIDGRSLPNTFLDFDVKFELGQYAEAKKILKSLEKDNSYGYLFRRSKMEHYDGSLDSAISYMMQAEKKSANNQYLQQVALSNAADLNVHAGNLAEAYELYVQSIQIDAADFHSMMGIGWLALVHDKNDSLAEKIFLFVNKYSASPDGLLKMAQVAEARGDSIMQKKYAVAFEQKVSDSSYGKMYTKYLIDLYTGILNNPAQAVILAENETYNRPTPQVYAWYVWSLFRNNQLEKADEIYKGYVSKQPLEGLELYYMGKMMQELNKGYNAQQFFKAAYKNRYDLSPAKVKELETYLK